MLMFFLNCLILCAISTQSSIFKSTAYQHFVEKENKGLDLLNEDGLNEKICNNLRL